MVAKPLVCSSATVATPDGTNFRNGSLRVLARSPYLLTGLSGLITSATRSLVCSMVRTLLTPSRGMVEHG